MFEKIKSFLRKFLPLSTKTFLTITDEQSVQLLDKVDSLSSFIENAHGETRRELAASLDHMEAALVLHQEQQNSAGGPSGGKGDSDCQLEGLPGGPSGPPAAA